ncbi:hypothetical protein [Hymenobacter sp.]|jgi:hypothetical protein|uniref:hypothetical protein n=1 Tax=Hymenobacter sp. TaxID=1898978 RepID=UPI002EDAE725
MAFFENAAGSLSEHTAEKYLRLDWRDDYLPDERIKELMEQLLLALQHRQWRKILFHQNSRGTLSVAASAWVSVDWLPRAVHAGYYYGAIILSRDMLTRLDTTAVGNDYSRRRHLPVYRFFEQEAEAVDWLLAAQVPNHAPKTRHVKH